MKYFNVSLLTDACADDLELAKNYFAYREAILPSLPPDLQCFVRKCSLHDAKLKQFVLSVSEAQLIIEFVGDHYGMELAPGREH